jgi:hypothetical protein
MTEIYKVGKDILSPAQIVYSEFATRVTLDGVLYEVLKWTSDPAAGTRTIELRRL